MHSYASDAWDRDKVPVFLAALAVVTALLLEIVTLWVGISIPWYIDSPSVMGFYGLFWKLYDAFAWRQRIGPVGLSAIPDLRGTWVGLSTSSHGGGQQSKAILHIRQTWSKMSVQLEAESSTSNSTMGALYTVSDPKCELQYEYVNRPRVFSAPTMHSHLGVTHLRIIKDANVLEGDYYTGRDRQSLGTLRFQFVSRKIIPFYEAVKLEYAQTAATG